MVITFFLPFLWLFVGLLATHGHLLWKGSRNSLPVYHSLLFWRTWAMWMFSVAVWLFCSRICRKPFVLSLNVSLIELEYIHNWKYLHFLSSSAVSLTETLLPLPFRYTPVGRNWSPSIDFKKGTHHSEAWPVVLWSPGSLPRTFNKFSYKILPLAKSVGLRIIRSSHLLHDYCQVMKLVWHCIDKFSPLFVYLNIGPSVATDIASKINFKTNKTVFLRECDICSILKSSRLLKRDIWVPRPGRLEISILVWSMTAFGTEIDWSVMVFQPGFPAWQATQVLTYYFMSVLIVRQ